MTRSKTPEFNAARIGYEIMGFPANGRTFFLGMRLLPPRAGMIAIVLPLLDIVRSHT
jgi:hypothetical protein